MQALLQPVATAAAVTDESGGNAEDARADEVAYRWTIADDLLRWDGDVEAVLGIAPDQAVTGRAFAAFVDPQDAAARRDAVLATVAADRGGGVPFRLEYALHPDGPAGEALWIEDSGRWYGDGGTRPARVVGVIRVVADRQERERRLAFRASYDELTGFFNRARTIDLLREELANANRFRTSAAFLLVAIDGFRLINDLYGFDVADQVLTVVARRIASRLRGGDYIGRFSASKFGVILREGDDAAMRVAAERFLAAVRDEVVTTDRGAVALSASIGGVTTPRHARSAAEAVARAEEALAASRARGRGHFQAYTHSPDREGRRKANAALSTQLLEAIETDRLRLAYQPVVDAATRRPLFHEALLRLEGPNGDIVPAHAFLPLAEGLSLGRLLDRRSLDLVLGVLAAEPEARLALNVTADTATEATWLAAVASAVGRQPDLAPRLIVEITESAAIANTADAARFVAALRHLGCRVAMDDFGAGFTSFRNLRRLDVDMVKIDGSFVENLVRDRDNQLFVRTLVDLARNLGLSVVAEWVENEEAAAMLTEWGVDALQGDHFGVASLDPPWH